MTRTFALVAVAIASLFSSTAHSGSVVISIRYSQTGVAIFGNAYADNGNIALHVVGFTSMTLAPLPQISPLDSQFVGDASGANLMITSVEGQDLIPIGDIYTGATFLAELTRAGGGSQIFSGDELFGYTALNQALSEPIGYELYVEGVPADWWEPETVPEPASVALVGVGLVALALVRRATR